ncbi:aminotransferase-like domain-containing protein [Brevibacterium aurantiacum]|uniref:Aminotransferase class I/II-fold pyridoxal phosphate-dependent enzyme n=1 Tax=Brevibacterium aurantiacum TaxID=273384 RepID=A0A4Z0KDU5_BREAU|nr:PLP-dependent aminotransferase family protein [Brevibacterium aurantiacum]TGD36709.1 aminotransferase class I/II-fold pyridoxal phosphate-dependent enzyme [Brevibacterium aurantiacum]
MTSSGSERFEDVLVQGDAESFAFDLGPGYLGEALLPTQSVANAYSAVLADLPRAALSYGPELGPRPAREAVAALRGVDPDAVMMTAGTSAMLDVIACANRSHGGTIIVEAVSYDLANAVFRDHGYNIARTRSEETDPVQALTQSLEVHHASAAFIYLTPTLGNPTGRTMTIEQRNGVIELAQRFDVQIIEDDAYADHAEDADRPLSLAQLASGLVTRDHQPLVIGLGSGSKVLGAGLRVGWLLAPPAWLHRFSSRGLFRSGGCANQIAALVLAHLLANGDYSRQVRRVRHVLSERARAFRTGIAETSEGQLTPSQHWAGGLFDWIQAPDPAAIARRGELEGIRLFAGNRFGEDSRGHLRIAYGTVSAKEAHEAGRRIGTLTTKTSPTVTTVQEDQ